MNLLKRILVLLTCMVLIGSFAACKKGDNSKNVKSTAYTDSRGEISNSVSDGTNSDTDNESATSNKDSGSSNSVPNASGNSQGAGQSGGSASSGGIKQTEKIYYFNVEKNANKNEIKKAIKFIYGVTPARISITQIADKTVTRRGLVSVKQGGKKAVVYLKKGDKITFA